MQNTNSIQLRAFLAAFLKPIFEEVIQDSIKIVQDNYINASTSNSDKSERYLTSKQVCELMQISNVCRHNYEKRGILKRVDFGGLPRYKLSDIEKQLDNRKK